MRRLSSVGNYGMTRRNVGNETSRMEEIYVENCLA